jgi:Asp-tRNA(Asn)/Glu-tRNA(Gln) amidotransferase C subunit
VTDPVDRLAELAGLELSDQERTLLRDRLAVLQTLIDALPDDAPGSAPVRAAPPIPLREDEPGTPLPVDEVVGMMPARERSWLDVPPVREEPR